MSMNSKLQIKELLTTKGTKGFLRQDVQDVSGTCPLNFDLISSKLHILPREIVAWLHREELPVYLLL